VLLRTFEKTIDLFVKENSMPLKKERRLES
jgi:hypothetical protein